MDEKDINLLKEPLLGEATGKKTTNGPGRPNKMFDYTLDESVMLM
jgi:hypothetical protein